MLRSSLLAAIIACTLSATSRAQVVAFDSAADLSQFSLNGAASSNFTWNATAGVGGGGGLVSTSTNFSSDSAIYTTGFDNAVGATMSVQFDYQMHLQGSGPDFRMGFGSSPAAIFDGSSLSLEIYGTTNQKTFQTPSGSTTITMTPDDWFTVRLDLVKDSPTSYSGTASVFDIGPMGLDSPTLVSSQGYSFFSPAFGGASQLFGGFYLHSASGGLDNFSAVPEPSTWALLSIGAIGVGVAIRRRRLRRNSAAPSVEAVAVSEAVAL